MAQRQASVVPDGATEVRGFDPRTLVKPTGGAQLFCVNCSCEGDNCFPISNEEEFAQVRAAAEQDPTVTGQVFFIVVPSNT